MFDKNLEEVLAAVLEDTDIRDLALKDTDTQRIRDLAVAFSQGDTSGFQGDGGRYDVVSGCIINLVEQVGELEGLDRHSDDGQIAWESAMYAARSVLAWAAWASVSEGE